MCRYPAGDSWCRSKSPHAPYAYKDTCLKDSAAIGVESIAKNLPKIVQDHINGLAVECTEVGGQFLDPSPAIKSGDFNRDAKPDYAVYNEDLVCEGAYSIYGGSGGSEVNFFVSTPSGYRKAGSNAAGGVSVEGDKIWLSLCGSYCSDPNFVSKAEAKCCERAFTWSKSNSTILLDQAIPPRSQ